MTITKNAKSFLNIVHFVYLTLNFNKNFKQFRDDNYTNYQPVLNL